MRCVIGLGLSDTIEKVFISFFYYLGYRGFVEYIGFADSRDVENLQGVAGPMQW